MICMPQNLANHFVLTLHACCSQCRLNIEVLFSERERAWWFFFHTAVSVDADGDSLLNRKLSYHGVSFVMCALFLSSILQSVFVSQCSKICVCVCARALLVPQIPSVWLTLSSSKPQLRPCHIYSQVSCYSCTVVSLCLFRPSDRQTYSGDSIAYYTESLESLTESLTRHMAHQ